MPIDNLANGEPTEDDIYLAKLTMDEVGADIEEHGHVAVTSENCTQDPFTAKGSLANALDEAVSVPSENIPEEKDPSGEGELHGEIEGVEMGNNPDTPTMDINNSKTTKDSLAAALDAVAMDARHNDTIESIKAEEVQENEIGDADTPKDDTDKKWLKQRDEAMKPELPKSQGGSPKTDDDGLVYLEYTFTIDPTTYRSNNYQPIANAAEAGKNKNVSVEGAKEIEQPEEAEQIEVAEVEEKETADEVSERVALDYATCYDGTSFLCFDEVDGIDYTKIAMDASPKTPNIKPTCKTTFAQCRAKNPLYCRFHGPKLLEKDIKQALTALLGKNSCTISVTKDKDSKNPMTFRLTVGCVPSMKKKVEDMVHKFMTQNPGIKSTEDWKDLGEKGGKIMETEEFEMDILQADKPPKASNWALQAKYDTEKAKEAGKKQAVVGETPSNIEAIAKGEKPPMGEKGKKNSTPTENDGSIGGIPAALMDESAQELADSGSIYWSDKNKNKNDLQNALKGNLVFSDTSFDDIKKILGADNPIVGAIVEAAKHPNFKTDIPKYAQEFGEDGEEVSGAEETKADGTSGITDMDIEEAANKMAAQPSQKKFYKDLIGKILNGESYLDAGGLKQWAEDLGEDNPVYKAIAAASTKKVTEITDKAQALYNKPAGHKAPSMSQDPDELESEMDALYNRAKEKYPEEEEKIDEISIHFNLMKEEGNISGMNQAIVDLKYLMSQKNKDANGSASETSTYDKDFGDAETAMKSLMDDATDYLAMGYMDVDDAHSSLMTAFNDIKNTKGNIEAIQKSISALDEEGNLSVSSVAKKKALLDGLKKFADHWPQAVKTFNEAKEAMKSAIEKAKGFDEDKMKAESAAKVEGIVRSVAKSLFPNGKTEGVESVAELIDFKESELNKYASENGISDKDLLGVKEKNGVFETYKAAANSNNEFDMAVKQFKEVIDDVKGTDGKETLETAAKEVSAKAVELEAAMGAYNKALEKAGQEFEFWKQIQDLASPPKESEGNNVETPKSMKGNAALKDKAAVEIANAISGSGYLFNKDNFIYPIDGTIWTDNLLKDEFDKTLEVGYDPNTGKVSYLAAKADEGNNMYFDSLEEAEKYLGLGKAAGKKVKPQEETKATTKVDGEVHGGYANIWEMDEAIKPLVSKAIAGKGFLFSTIKSEDGKELTVVLEQKSPKQDEYGDNIDLTEDEITTLQQALNRELATAGLVAQKSKLLTHYGTNAYFDIKKEEPKYGKSSTVAKAPAKKTYTKEMLAAMSPKDKLTAAIAIAKKKLAANPSDEGLKAKLAKWEKQLASLG